MPKKKKHADKRGASSKRNELEREQLYREIKYGAEAVRRHEGRWRQLVYQFALPNIQQEVIAFWHTFEYLVDTKDFTISLLLDELSRAEEQYQLLVRAHIDGFDRIVSLWKTQSTALWNDSQLQISNLYKAAIVERNDIQVIAKENEDFLKTVSFGLEEAQREQDIHVHGVNLAQHDVFRNATDDVVLGLVNKIGYIYTQYQSEAKAFVEQYDAYFSEQAKEFAGIEEEDERMTKQIQDDWKHIEACYNQIHYWHEKQDGMDKENQNKLARLTAELNFYNEIFTDIKKQLREDKVLDNEQLTYLATESNKAIHEMEQFEKKGELLLKMITVCRKLETSEEKILAFPKFALPGKKKKKKETEQSREDNILNSTKGLKLFWNHLANLDVSRYDLAAQCEHLRQENEMLRKKVIEYCECLDCEPQVLFLYENSNILKG